MSFDRLNRAEIGRRDSDSAMNERDAGSQNASDEEAMNTESPNMNRAGKLPTASWGILTALSLWLAATARPAEPAQEFVGPFPNWADVKRDYGAVGDGRADDTAALQQALDDLHREDRKCFVLYVPAGTYRVMRTLVLFREKHNESKDVAFIGEDPATTTLRWDGPADGVMLDYGAWYSKLGRLTFDGQGKARTAIAHGKSFATYNEFFDVVIRDVGIGIEAGAPGGQGIAETTVLRCQFLRCAVAGISIQNFNSLDWFVWHSVFEDCGLGVTNLRGAGNFHVFESLFRRSREADIGIGNTGYFSFRNNTSLESKAFFVGKPIGAAALVTLQGNAVYGGPATLVEVGNLGPLLLLDNILQTRRGPAVRLRADAGLLSVGNTFTCDPAIVAKTNRLAFDDKVVPFDALKETLPELPGTPPNRRRPVIEVPPGAADEAIQRALDEAGKLDGQHAVVHLPAGDFRVAQTLTIPAGRDLQLVGDGVRTRLVWTGPSTGPVLRLAGPSRATLRDLEVNGSKRADGIVIEKCDQPGARIYMEQPNVDAAQRVGFFVDGVELANVELRNMNHGGCALGVKVRGGERLSAGQSAPGRVAIFAGSSSNNQLSYDVTEGGRLLARDIWYESGSEPRFMRLSGRGELTLHGAIMACALSKNETEPAIELDNFSGQLSLLNVQWSGGGDSMRLVCHGEGRNTAMLGLGAQVGKSGPRLDNQSPHARLALLEVMHYTEGGGAAPSPDVGAADPDFIRSMIAPTRAERPRPLTPVPAGITDVRFFRVVSTQGRDCIRLTHD